jgi:hypothetical protein
MRICGGHVPTWCNLKQLKERGQAGFGYRRNVSLHRDPQKQVVAIIGKCHSHTGRKELVEQLSKHLKVDSFGACLQNSPPPVEGASWYNMYGESKLSLMGQYHFCAAFENSRHPDYVTEKVFQVGGAGCGSAAPRAPAAPRPASLARRYSACNSLPGVGSGAGGRVRAALRRRTQRQGAPA